MMRSIRIRLYVISVLLIVVVLFVVSQILVWLFEQHVYLRVEKELSNHLNQVVSKIDIEIPSNQFQPVLSDPRFELPGSGLYWQLSIDDGKPSRSRSLWDDALDLSPVSAKFKNLTSIEIPGPDEQPITAVLQDIEVNSAGNLHNLRIVVGQNKSITAEAVGRFRNALWYSLAILAVALAFATWLQITAGLQPLNRLQEEIAAVRRGEAKGIFVTKPTELVPVLDEFNGLLTQQQTAIEKSLLRAGSLAHGLKTPLAILMSIARKLEQTGQQESAFQMREQLDSLRKHVERELARARTVGNLFGVRNRTHLKPLCNQVIETLRRLPRGRQIEWIVDVDESLVVPVSTDDLAEIIGNILDNARKWANSKVFVSVMQDEAGTTIRIGDDGDQLPTDKIEGLSNRGERHDDSADGSGLGLSIVKDVLEEYGGRLTIRAASAGGLEVEAFVPSAMR